MLLYHGSKEIVKNPEIRISRTAFWELAKFKKPAHQISFHTAIMMPQFSTVNQSKKLLMKSYRFMVLNQKILIIFPAANIMFLIIGQLGKSMKG